MFHHTLVALALILASVPAVASADDSGWVPAPHDSSPGNVPVQDQQQINGYLDTLNAPPPNDGATLPPQLEPEKAVEQPRPEVNDRDTGAHVEPTARIPDPQERTFGDGAAY